jgi:hypothetical protein
MSKVNKESMMETNHVKQAEEYYKLMGAKDLEGIKKYLHQDVEFHGPLASLKGKEAVIEANRNFMNMFTSLTIRAKLGAGEQAMLVYEIDVPGIVKDFPGTSLLTFRDGLIAKIQLFYDGSRFVEKRDEVFSRS